MTTSKYTGLDHIVSKTLQFELPFYDLQYLAITLRYFAKLQS